MNALNVARVLGAAAICGLLLNAPIDIASASADPCPDIGVVFARGTNEPPGVGVVGQAFVDSLTQQVRGRSVATYPVDYPATDDYVNSSRDGANNADAQIQQTVASCPNTKLVLGGYSQGAAVIDTSTMTMPPRVADHVAAVAVFGNPSSNFARSLGGGTLPAISPLYRSKTIDLCVPNDPICSEGTNMVAHVMYVPGMTNDAAAFTAGRV